MWFPVDLLEASLICWLPMNEIIPLLRTHVQHGWSNQTLLPLNKTPAEECEGEEGQFPSLLSYASGLNIAHSCVSIIFILRSFHARTYLRWPFVFRDRPWILSAQFTCEKSPKCARKSSAGTKGLLCSEIVSLFGSDSLLFVCRRGINYASIWAGFN